MGKKILIADDEKSIREPLKDSLEAVGFEIIEADNGQETLDVALKEHPDLILLDVMMPRLSGEEIIKKLAEDKWGKDAKLLLLTNVSDPEKMSEITGTKGSNITLFDYLVKSDWEITDVVEKVKEKLGVD